MNDWPNRLGDLTPDQLKVKEIPPRQSALVLGPPGSGKTHVLVHRAAYLVQSQKISVQKIRLFVSTEIMEKHIRSMTKSLGYPEEIVTTFDQWCHSFYVKNISQNLPRVYIDGRIDFKKIHHAVLGALKKKRVFRNSLEHVLVDDGQDMTPEALKVLGLVAQYITVFADSHHKLSEEGASEFQIKDTLKLNKSKFILQGDFRSSRPVAELASFFVKDENFRNAYLSGDRLDDSASEDFLCCIAPSEEEELSQLSLVVRRRLAIKNKVGILVPTNRLVHRIAKALEDTGIKTEKAIPLSAQNVIHRPYDFDNDFPKITTYNMARGLTFDSVFLPQLTERAFSEIPLNSRRKLLFLGIVRASKWVYLSTVKSQEFKEMDILKSAERAGHLWIFEKVP